MRTGDKKKHIEKLNKRLNENKFSWDGTYANEVEENTIGFGDDIEVVDEECGCSLKQPEPTDVKNSQWFSDVDGNRLIDKDEI